ncbi:MAG: universal stress protein [Desulfobacterales bacterium]|nr:universal stress protein [Desulfobacterales bacterium]
MGKEILLAVDKSQHSKYAVQYALSMASVIRELNYTLYSVQPALSQYLVDEAEQKPSAKEKLNDLHKKYKEESRAILDEIKKQMIDAGADGARIKTISRPRMSGIAKDIIDFARASKLDAIVVGRRGISKIQDAFIGSVTRMLMAHVEVTPVWVVDDKVESQKIMIAVDGSESAMRVVDHVSFMLKDNSDADITLIHVQPKLGDYHAIDFNDETEALGELIVEGEQRRVNNFFSHARKKFNDAGIHEGQLHIKDVACRFNVGKAIIAEAEKGNFGTIAIGRSGISKSFFFGSVSNYVLENASNCAVWLVP